MSTCSRHGELICACAVTRLPPSAEPIGQNLKKFHKLVGAVRIPRPADIVERPPLHITDLWLAARAAFDSYATELASFAHDLDYPRERKKDPYFSKSSKERGDE